MEVVYKEQTITQLNDTDILTFGKAHNGKALANVPADYLMWIHTLENKKYIPLNLQEYVERNLDVIKSAYSKKNKTIF